MKNLILLLTCSVLASCASVMDSQKVQMTVRTPGAENAKCYIQNKEYRYLAYTDQTIEIMKTPYDFTVYCMAPGNREKTVLAKLKLNKWVFANVANGFVPGVAYDLLSHGAFDYPDEVVVDFSGQSVTAYDLPAYMSDDLIGHGYVGKMENYGTGRDVMSQSDRNAGAFELQKKEGFETAPTYNSAESDVKFIPTYTYDEKVDVPVTSRRRAYDLPAVSYDPLEEDK